MQHSKIKRKFLILENKRKLLKYQSLGVIKMKKNDQSGISKLDSSINKEIQTSELDLAVPVINELQIKTPGNKLFNFFKEKAKIAEGRYELEKIRIYTEIMNNIVEAVKQRENMKRFKLNKMHKELEELYQNLHQLYEQQFQGKQHLKQMIEEKQQQKANSEAQLAALREEKILFLRLMLRNGFYRKNGIQWYFQKMIQSQYVPIPYDFPSFLDPKTIECLMKEYRNLKEQKIEKKKLPLISQVNSDFQKITSHSRVKTLHDETKNYINNWIKKQGWRNRSLKHIQMEECKKQAEEWKEAEARRMKDAYDKDTYKKVMKIAFGVTNYKPHVKRPEFLLRKKGSKA